jgi:hypothetical protein
LCPFGEQMILYDYKFRLRVLTIMARKVGINV